MYIEDGIIEKADLSKLLFPTEGDVTRMYKNKNWREKNKPHLVPGENECFLVAIFVVSM